MVEESILPSKLLNAVFPGFLRGSGFGDSYPGGLLARPEIESRPVIENPSRLEPALSCGPGRRILRLPRRDACGRVLGNRGHGRKELDPRRNEARAARLATNRAVSCESCRHTCEAS